MKDGNNTAIATDDFFKGKKVALFAVPGAFTPTCSAKHLPSFLENADALKKKGIDAIACVAVNDPFVMRAWGENAKSGDAIAMLSDGNGEFARAVGLARDYADAGMGERPKIRETPKKSAPRAKTQERMKAAEAAAAAAAPAEAKAE